MGNVLGQGRLILKDGSFRQQLVLHKKQRPRPGRFVPHIEKQLALWLSMQECMNAIQWVMPSLPSVPF